jgi:hypothetical protein
MRISGHRMRSVFERYSIVDERDLCAAATKLRKHLATKAAGNGSGNGNDESGMSQASL